MNLPHRIMNNRDVTHTETALLDLIRWCSLFFPPSLCELVLPFHSMSYYSWRAIAGGWGDVKFKEWWPNKFAPIKSNSEHCLGNPRNQILRNKGASSVLRQAATSGGCLSCTAGNYANSQQVCWWGGLISADHAHTPWKPFNAWWCKWYWDLHVGRLCKQSRICLFKKESESTPIVFLEKGSTKHRVLQGVWLKPTSCYGHTHGTAHAW